MLKLFVSLYLLILTIYALQSTLVESVFYSSYKSELDDDVVRDYMGLYLLLEQLQVEQNPEQWQEMLKNINKASNTPVEARPFESWGLPKDAQAVLKGGGVWVENWDDDITYKSIGSNIVAKIGPMQTMQQAEDAYQYTFLIAPIFLGLTILLWLGWLQFCLKRLELAVIRLSEGKLDTQVPIGMFAVGNLNKAFNVMAERLNRLFASHKHLTNAVSHELRSPIGRIRFQLEMIEDTNDESKRSTHIKGISDDVDDMDRLVEEMLTYARMERAEAVAHKNTFNINGWLNAQRQHLKREVSTSITLQLSDDTEVISADSMLLARLVRNLVCNADRYARDVITIGAGVAENEQYLWVDDDGPGIPIVEREHLFEPFVLLERSRNKAQSGYGLGLAIASQIARCHGGRLHIQDSEHGGARLLMIWPLEL